MGISNPDIPQSSLIRQIKVEIREKGNFFNMIRNYVKYIITNFIYEGPPIMIHPKDERLGQRTNDTSKLGSVEEEMPKPENDEI